MITMEQLHKAKTIIDILPEKATRSILSYQEIQISIVDDRGDALKSEFGIDPFINQNQNDLLQTVEYSDNIYIKANYTSMDPIDGTIRNDKLTYFITVIPENEANYSKSRVSLLQYLRAGTQSQTASVHQSKLRPARINFTVTSHGEIVDVSVKAESGYPSIDSELVNLIKNMPGEWTPATNSHGEAVDQELIFFFGKAGC